MNRDINIDTEQRVARAKELFNSGYNCCQAVVMAYADVVEIEPTLAATIAAPFGGGMGRLREVCGAVSGMTMLAGFISPCPTADSALAKRENYALVQRFAEAFRAQNGAIVCRTLLGLDHAKDDPTPSPRTAEYYRKRPCAELVGDAARIVAQHLVENSNK
ncbi:MAG: C_GCAxxG_C_C family protein [Alistipes sp.]|nr:C_GCAxxG_C_C family protein [Alistipes sp.]